MIVVTKETWRRDIEETWAGRQGSGRFPDSSWPEFSCWESAITSTDVSKQWWCGGLQRSDILLNEWYEVFKLVETTNQRKGSWTSLWASRANSGSSSCRSVSDWLSGLTGLCSERGAARRCPEFRKTPRLWPPQAGSQEEAGWEGMAWSVFPFQRTRLCGVWRRSSSAWGHHRGSRHYDGSLPLRGRRLHGHWSVGQKERGDSRFDRFVFQDAIQSKGSHSSGKIRLCVFQLLHSLSFSIVWLINRTALRNQGD